MGAMVVAPVLYSTSSIAVVLGFSLSAARGIFPDQGSNLCLLHWEEDSLPLGHPEAPRSSLTHFDHFYLYTQRVFFFFFFLHIVNAE